MSTHTNSSLYVGDLLPDVNETYLYEVFRQIGPIVSVKVCRDSRDSKSLGYAYVNFQSPTDAARAIEVLNFAEIKGKPMRIMYVQRDPSVRNSGLGNIFIKNLDKSIDNKTLYETFSYFGTILSCKVCTRKVEKVGSDGKANFEDESLGYGFVHFETGEAAQLAISKVNGMIIEGKKVSVAPFIKRVERKSQSTLFTNIYVKDLDPSVDVKVLGDFFSKFGELDSVWVATDKDNKTSKCFGFLNYKKPEDAKKAISECDGKKIDGISLKDKPLYVSKAEKKEERKMKLVKQHEALQQSTQGLNLYVKHFEDGTDEEKLRKMFEPFGKIQSVHIKKDKNGNNVGFGFVCFEKREDAGKAVSELHNKIIGSKPLYVTIHQRKDIRGKEVEQQRLQLRQQGNLFGQQGNIFGQNNQRQNFNSQNQKQRWGQKDKNVKSTGTKKDPKKEKTDKPQKNQKTEKTGENIKFVQNVRNPKQTTSKPKTETKSTSQTESSIYSQLSQMSPRSQKQTLGDHLFPMVHSAQPTLATKITGMLLEMENGDIIHLLESPEALNSKIIEAVTVLKSHQEKEMK